VGSRIQTVPASGNQIPSRDAWIVTFPPAQVLDWDGDGLPDACDPDDDNDGVLDDGDGSGVIGDKPCVPGVLFNRCDDNCRTTPNPDQQDNGRDGVGDVCDNCPRIPNRNQRDSDGDAVLGVFLSDPNRGGDVCDCDDDNDGVADPDIQCGPGPYDNCPYVKNATQDDFDWDGIGFACDPREQYRFRTGLLWFDARLEALAEVLKEMDITGPWTPEGPPCRICKSVLEDPRGKAFFNSARGEAKKFVGGLGKRSTLDVDDVLKYMNISDKQYLPDDSMRRMLEHTAKQKSGALK